MVFRPNRDSAVSRRHFVAGTTAFAVVGASRQGQAQSRQKVNVSVGRQPWAAGNSPITQYMMENKLFEKHAADLGYDLTVDWRDYPSALPQVEAFVSGNLDLGMWGNTPIIRGIAAGQPWSMINIGEGHFRFVLGTRPDSGIRNIQDLKGKTIGALLGGDPYNVLSQMLLAELGSGDPKAHDIKIINTPTQAQAATIPRGMDAAVLIYPAFLKAQQEVGTVGVVNSFGYTEAGYKGPAGEGAGILLPSVKKSAFYPEGFYEHRSFWVGQNKLIEAHPKIIVAFVGAQQEASAKLKTMEPASVAKMVQKYWELPPELGAKVVGDELLFIRGWVWPTEGDVNAVRETSKFMVEGRLIDKPLTWQQVKDNLARTAPLLKEAYERTGRVPDAEDFTSKEAKDVRGMPVWQLAEWKDRT